VYASDARAGHSRLAVGHAAADLQLGTGSGDVHDALIDTDGELRGPQEDRTWWEVAGLLIIPTDPADWLPSWTEAGLPVGADEARRRHASGLDRALDCRKRPLDWERRPARNATPGLAPHTCRRQAGHPTMAIN
jgi:hypothetical protein